MENGESTKFIFMMRERRKKEKKKETKNFGKWFSIQIVAINLIVLEGEMREILVLSSEM